MFVSDCCSQLCKSSIDLLGLRKTPSSKILNNTDDGDENDDCDGDGVIV